MCILDSVANTNDEAFARAGEPGADGLVILADFQDQGRGRLGRRWESPRGASLLMSILLLDETPRDGRSAPVQADAPMLAALVTAVAATDAIAESVGVQPTIKWPNDLLIAGRKVAGILVEVRRLAATGPSGEGPAMERTATVVGIGINCLQQPGHFLPELRERATSLDQVAAGPIDRCLVARALLAHLDRWFAAPGGPDAAEVRRQWLARAEPLGRRIHLLHAGRRFSGHVVDLDPTAALLVQLDEGSRRLFDAAGTTVLD